MTDRATVCELHAESVFKIEGMDCHEEVAILEQRAEAAGRARGARRRRDRPAAEHQVRRREADDRPRSRKRWRRPACAPGSSTRSRGRRAVRDHARARLVVALRRRSSAAGLALAVRRPCDRRAGVAASRWRSSLGGVHTGAPRAGCRSRSRVARHQRADAGRGRRRDRARRMVRRRRRSCSCSRWRSCSRRARWSGRAARSAR